MLLAFLWHLPQQTLRCTGIYCSFLQNVPQLQIFVAPIHFSSWAFNKKEIARCPKWCPGWRTSIKCSAIKAIAWDLLYSFEGFYRFWKRHRIFLNCRITIYVFLWRLHYFSRACRDIQNEVSCYLFVMHVFWLMGAIPWCFSWWRVRQTLKGVREKS